MPGLFSAEIFISKNVRLLILKKIGWENLATLKNENKEKAVATLSLIKKGNVA